MPQTDEGEVTVSARMAVGTRVERTEQIALRLEEMVRAHVPEAVTLISSAGGGGFMGGSASSANITVKLKPRGERTRTSDQIATDLRPLLVGMAGTTITTRASGGNQALTRALGGGNQDSRFAVEIRGEDIAESKRLALDVLEVLKDTRASPTRKWAVKRAGLRWPSAWTGRRPHCSGSRSRAWPAPSARTSAARRPPSIASAARSSPSSFGLREEDRDRVDSVNDVLISTPGGLVLQAEEPARPAAADGPHAD